MDCIEGCNRAIAGRRIGFVIAEEKDQLKASFDDLVRDTPRTELAATRFKKLAVKAGKGTAEALKEIIVQVASETAKKLLLGP